MKLPGPILKKIGKQMGQLVARKNKAYGNSYAQTAEFLKMLYPKGVTPSQYNDMLTIVRIFDKLARIATDKDAFGESPYKDIVGYGILGVAYNEIKEKKP